MIKDSKQKRTGGQKCCLSGFPACASHWAILWKKLHFLPEVNMFSTIRPTIWRNSAHTNVVDVQLNNTMRTITGAVRCTRTDWLPVLSNIAPADIRREVATSRTILRARGKPELPLLIDIDFHPRPRLKSRRPIWSNLPEDFKRHRSSITSGAHGGRIKSLMSQICH